MLPVEARPISAGRDDAFDIRQLSHSVTILRQGNGVEEVLVGDGIRHIQLEVRGWSLLDGPATLHCEITGVADAEPKLLTLQRLVALRRLGRFPHSLFLPERRVRRWIMALRALDATRVGAAPREIAAALFGDDIASRDWDGGSDYLRSRVRRAIAAGQCLASGSHLELLRRLPRRNAVSLAEDVA